MTPNGAKTPQQEWLEKELRIAEREKAEREWLKKPYWVRMAEEGDYMADGSDLQEYYKEEEDER